MKTLLTAALGAYRFLVSPIFAAMGTRCRYHPSCSEYARDALNAKPLGKAMWLIAKRLFRCGPWSPGGVDYVK